MDIFYLDSLIWSTKEQHVLNLRFRIRFLTQIVRAIHERIIQKKHCVPSVSIKDVAVLSMGQARLLSSINVQRLNERKMKQTILNLGMLIFETLVADMTSEHSKHEDLVTSCPILFNMLNSSDDSLDAAQTCESEINSIFDKVSNEYPSWKDNEQIDSLKHLCIECCKPCNIIEMDTEGVLDWLNSVQEELETSNKADDKKRVCDFKTLRIYVDHVEDWQVEFYGYDIEEEGSTSEDSEADLNVEDCNVGYESEDSFLPADDSRGNLLGNFLSQSAVEPDPPSPTKLESFEQIPEEKLSNLVGKFNNVLSNAAEGVVLTPMEVHERFAKQQLLTEEEAIRILLRAHEIFRGEPNVMHVDSPTTFVGDIHGQYYDLIHLLDSADVDTNTFELKDNSKSSKLVFLGDYVDRGSFSCEVILFLFALKLAQPDRVILLRGNHECDLVSSFYGFKDECFAKYGRLVFQRSLSAFRSMPLAAVASTELGDLLCLHGGISPDFSSLDVLRSFDRFVEPGKTGLLCDILWADPIKETEVNFIDEQAIQEFEHETFKSNPMRGCSYQYGIAALDNFLKSNQLVGLIRAHEVQMEGYRIHFEEAKHIKPLVVTIFSAPDYCGRYGNKGAIVHLRTGSASSIIDLLEPIQFDAVDHPEPVEIESEADKRSRRFAEICPYFPSTMPSFVRAAKEIGEEYGYYDKHESKKMQKRDSSGFKKLRGAVQKIRALNIAKASLTNRRTSRYNSIAAADAVNEMNPTTLRAQDSGRWGKLRKQYSFVDIARTTGQLDEFRNSKYARSKSSPVNSTKDIAEAVMAVLERESAQEAQKLSDEGDTTEESKPNRTKQVRFFPDDEDAIQHSESNTTQQEGVSSDDEDKTQLGESDTIQQDGISFGNQDKTKRSEYNMTDSKNTMLSNNVDEEPYSIQQMLKTMNGEIEATTSEEDRKVLFSDDELHAFEYLFYTLDRGNDGTISKEEIKQAGLCIAYELEDSEIDLVIRALDSSGLGEISIRDFLTFASKLKQIYLHQLEDE